MKRWISSKNRTQCFQLHRKRLNQTEKILRMTVGWMSWRKSWKISTSDSQSPQQRLLSTSTRRTREKRAFISNLFLQIKLLKTVINSANIVFVSTNFLLYRGSTRKFELHAEGAILPAEIGEYHVVNNCLFCNTCFELQCQFCQ